MIVRARRARKISLRLPKSAHFVWISYSAVERPEDESEIVEPDDTVLEAF